LQIARDHAARGQIDEAIRCLDAIPDGSPAAPEARLRAGQMELRRNRMRAAERYLLAAIALEPKLVQARRELIYIYGMQLRQADQDTQFRALAAITPLTARDLFIWCMPRGSSTWDAEDLASYLRKFVDAGPDDRWSRLALVEALRRCNRLDEAESVAAALAAADPDAQVLRAALALDRGDPEAAGRILAEGPCDHPALAQQRGQQALLRRDAAEGLKQFRIAYRGGRTNREVIRGLAQALQQAGETEEAARYFDRAEAMDRLTTLVQQAARREALESPELLRQLGAACAAAGRTDEAAGWYRLAIAHDPLDREAQMALHALARPEPGEEPGSGPGSP
jgi:tetratricopeptide (TPR) repeat protein